MYLGSKMSKPVYVKIESLTPSSRGVNVLGKILEKGETRTVTFRSDGTEHHVADALIGDESGCIQLTLWDEAIEEISVGDVIEIENGYVNTFRGSMRLNIGKYGSYKKSDEEISTVNLENNLSEKTVAEAYRWSYRERSSRLGKTRRMYKAVCSDCGKEIEVPFKPVKGRPVYCRECYQKHRRY